MTVDIPPDVAALASDVVPCCPFFASVVVLLVFVEDECGVEAYW